MAVRNALLRTPIRAPAVGVPRVAFTDPAFAHVGLTEEQARHRYGAIRVLRWPYAENERARIERETAGMVKIIATPFARIVGATVVGAHAGETIAVFSLAIARRMRIHAVADLPIPYPALATAARAAAASDRWRRLTRPWVRRMIGWSRKFG
jgi:pyruvate/2-oxoglutarate dehydrogenase complex dihydrolipoamide dehydrogenase (E3) component